MVKVLIVDDSPVVQQLLEYILSQDPEISVVGIANNGVEAIRDVRNKKPDIVTMDINMPVMNGFEATRIIMETNPIPIIIVTGNENLREVATSFTAIEAGAVTVMARPPGIHNPDFEKASQSLRNAVKTYQELKLVRRYAKGGIKSVTRTFLKSELSIETHRDPVEVVAIGASTGGPIVIQTILSGLKKNLPVPVVIVQHIAKGFTPGFAEWLQETTGFLVHIASDGEPLFPGHGYIAPDGFQMGVAKGNHVIVTGAPAENGLCPSVSYLFRSIRQVHGNRTLAVLLTGMGRDGAEELKALKECGATTIIQDEQSSVVYGMPGEAIKIGAAMYVLSPEKIADAINIISNRRNP